jgi:hypothetical protein
VSRLTLGALVSLLVAFAGAVAPLQVCVAAGERGCVSLIGAHAFHVHHDDLGHGNGHFHRHVPGTACDHGHDHGDDGDHPGGCPGESPEEGPCCADEAFARSAPGGTIGLVLPACLGVQPTPVLVGSDVVTAERPPLAPGVLERESVVLIR